MISIEDKMYITKQINTIVVRYAKQVVLKQLLLQFSFNKPKKAHKKKAKNVTHLIESVSNYNEHYSSTSPELALEVLECVWAFLKPLDKSQLTALYFLVLNENYLNHLDDFENNTAIETMSDAQFNTQFGRELAYKIHQPDATQLDNDLETYLTSLLCNFALEFDMSLVDKHTVTHINDMINNYAG